MPLPVTEDTPPDMLAGAMDIKVLLPGGRTVGMSVDRSTPMMDLLVAVSTAHALSPAAHALTALGERGLPLHHLPSTPLGALDTRLLHLTARAPTTLKRAPARPPQQQPFAATFRLQVHLPRNQLFVTRVTAETKLGDVLRLACHEKNLDPAKYEMRHPADLQQRLSPTRSLADYRLQEVAMVAKRPPGSPLTPADIMALHREEGIRRQQVKATGNTAYPSAFARRTSGHQSTGSVSSDSLNGRSISPVASDGELAPPAPAPEPPKRPGRKRRPAPKPPGAPMGTQSSTGTTAVAGTGTGRQAEVGVGKLIEAPAFHSRSSSDSSGYHEAVSVLSEGADPRSAGDSSSAGDTLPRRSKLPAAAAARAKAATLQPGVSLSRSLCNLAAAGGGLSGQHSASTASLSSQGGQRKKKAAPPPPSAPARRPVQLPPSVTAIAETNEDRQTPSRVAVKEAAPRVHAIETSNEAQQTPLSVAVKEAPSTRVAVKEVAPVVVPVKEAAPRVHAIETSNESQQSAPPRVGVKEAAPVTVTVNESPPPRKCPPTVVDITADPPKASTPLSPAPNPASSVTAPAPPRPSPRTRPAPRPRARAPADTPVTAGDVVEAAVDASPPRDVTDDAAVLPRVVAVEVKAPLRATRSTPAVAAPTPTVALLTSLGEDTGFVGAELARWDAVDRLHDDRSRPAFLLGDPDDAVEDSEDSEAAWPSTPRASGGVSPDEWAYTLPAPPSAFRDTSSPAGTEFGTVALADVRAFDEDDDQDHHEGPEVDRDCRPAPAEPEDSWEPQQLVKSQPAQPQPIEATPVSPARFAPDAVQLRARAAALVPRADAPAVVAPPASSGKLGNFTIGSYDFKAAVPEPKQAPSEPKQFVAEAKQATEPEQAVLEAKQPEAEVARVAAEVPRAEPEAWFSKPAVAIHKPSLVRTASSASSAGSLPDGVVRGAAVKRATSYLSLARPYTRPAAFASVARAHSVTSLLAEDAAVEEAPLQSLSVLRTILGRSQDALDAAGDAEDRLAPAPAPTPAPAPAPSDAFVYRGPPAVAFGSWSERPKAQVTLKSDRDYRVGGPGSSTGPALRRLVEERVLRPQPLTMRIVAQAYRHSSPDDDDVEVSRVPVVRAVELKKPGASSTLLNGDRLVESAPAFSAYHGTNANPITKTFVDATAVPPNPGSSNHGSHSNTVNANPTNKTFSDKAFSDKAKVFGNPGFSTTAAKRYTSVVGVNGGKPMPTVKGFRTSEVAAPEPVVVKGQGKTPPSDVAVKAQGKTPPSDVAVKAQGKTPPSEVAVKGQGKTAPSEVAVVVQPLRTINGAEHNVRAASGWAARGVDVVKLKRPVQRPVLERQFTNPRDALMDAIKNFGGQDALRLKSDTDSG